MVVCQPGITEVAKSILTIVCTDSTRGVERPANTKLIASYLDQCFAEPIQPKLNAPYITLLIPVALSRIVAKSGINPTYQKTRDTVKYVLIANTSHIKGELKLTQSEPNELGNGNAQ